MRLTGIVLIVLLVMLAAGVLAVGTSVWVGILLITALVAFFGVFALTRR